MVCNLGEPETDSELAARLAFAKPLSQDQCPWTISQIKAHID